MLQHLYSYKDDKGWQEPLLHALLLQELVPWPQSLEWGEGLQMLATSAPRCPMPRDRKQLVPDVICALLAQEEV